MNFSLIFICSNSFHIPAINLIISLTITVNSAKLILLSLSASISLNAFATSFLVGAVIFNYPAISFINASNSSKSINPLLSVSTVLNAATAIYLTFESSFKISLNSDIFCFIFILNILI